MGSIEIEHEFTSDVVCPHCGVEYSDSYEFFINNSDCAEGIECDNCKKKFNAVRNISVDYSTSKQP